MLNPIPLRRTDQNKGERCGPRYYTDVSGDDDYNPVCYELQLKLVKASLEGDLQKMREALGDGANVEGSVYDYYPPLQTAAMQGNNEVVRLLIENGADVNRLVEFENTPLNAGAWSVFCAGC
jgi:ankyrin repeat protein